MDEVYEDVDRFIQESEYDVRTLGFDPYNAKEFVARWEQENGPYGIEKVIQGARTESVPLGELKILAGERMLVEVFDNIVANESPKLTRRDPHTALETNYFCGVPTGHTGTSKLP